MLDLGWHVDWKLHGCVRCVYGQLYGAGSDKRPRRGIDGLVHCYPGNDNDGNDGYDDDDKSGDDDNLIYDHNLSYDD